MRSPLLSLIVIRLRLHHLYHTFIVLDFIFSRLVLPFTLSQLTKCCPWRYWCWSSRLIWAGIISSSSLMSSFFIIYFIIRPSSYKHSLLFFCLVFHLMDPGRPILPVAQVIICQEIKPICSWFCEPDTLELIVIIEYEYINGNCIDYPKTNNVCVFGSLLKTNWLGYPFEYAWIVINELLKDYYIHDWFHFLYYLWMVGKSWRDELSKKVEEKTSND